MGELDKLADEYTAKSIQWDLELTRASRNREGASEVYKLMADEARDEYARTIGDGTDVGQDGEGATDDSGENRDIREPVSTPQRIEEGGVGSEDDGPREHETPDGQNTGPERSGEANDEGGG